MGIKTSQVVLKTNLEIREAARVVNDFFAREKAQVEGLEPSSNPLDALEGGPTLAVVGSRQGMMNQWAVQVYFEPLGNGTEITLIAIGDSGMSRAMVGTRYTASLSKSTAQAQKLIGILRSVDSG